MDRTTIYEVEARWVARGVSEAAARGKESLVRLDSSADGEPIPLRARGAAGLRDRGGACLPSRHSISAQFMLAPQAYGAGTLDPNFDYDASRRANVAAWEGTQRGGSTFSGVTRYPQNLNLPGSVNATYQLRGSASVLMEGGRQRHANPQWRNGFIAKVHELAMMGIIDALVDGTFDDIDPERYEDIPIRN